VQFRENQNSVTHAKHPLNTKGLHSLQHSASKTKLTLRLNSTSSRLPTQSTHCFGNISIPTTDQIQRAEVKLLFKFHVVIFWVVPPCSDTTGYQHLVGPCCFHLWGEPRRLWYESSSLWKS